MFFSVPRRYLILLHFPSNLGIDLENIVYYKDDTHYFVMTAKKQSLLEKGVILHVSVASTLQILSIEG